MPQYRIKAMQLAQYCVDSFLESMTQKSRFYGIVGWFQNMQHYTSKDYEVLRDDPFHETYW